jgi:hypothetical protein
MCDEGGFVNRNRTLLAGSALVAALAQTVAAQATPCAATTLCRSDTITNIGTIGTPALSIATTANSTNGPFSGSISEALDGNAFGAAGQLAVGSDFSTGETVQSASGSVAPDSGWNFYDDYFFSTTAATANNATVISNFSQDSISNLQVRIFASGGQSGTPNPAPTLGIPTGGAVDGWSAPLVGSNGSLSILLPTGFPSGSYDLQVRGEALGPNASYGGTLQIAPVPVPAGLPMLLSGLGMLGSLMRRRRAT